MAEDIKKIVEQLRGFESKEDLPSIKSNLITEERVKLLDDNWEIITRGAQGARRNPMISQGEAAWLVKLAGECLADIEFLKYFITKKGDIPYSSASLRDLFPRYLNYFVKNQNPSEATEVTTLATIRNIPEYLKVTVPSIPLDQRIVSAVQSMEKKYSDGKDDGKFSPIARYLNNARSKFNSEDHLGRLLLSKVPIYRYILTSVLEGKDGNGVALTPEAKKELLQDTTGLVFEVKQKLQEIREECVKAIIKSVLDANKIKFSDETTGLDNIFERIEAEGLKIGPQALEQQIIRVHKEILDEGGIKEYVQQFKNRGEIKEGKFNADIERRMVSHLLAAGVNITDDTKFNDGGYDEYFALAYNNATSTSENSMYGSPTAGGWDFSVDTFDEVVDQAISRENILAAGFLDYAYELGEKAHIFQLMDVLYLNWHRGILDLPQSGVTDTLERLWQDRERRNTPEARGMSYKKTLGKGDAQVLDRMIVNDQFGELWSSLMEGIANFIRKSEEISVYGEGAAPVSRVPIYQATKELQYNLTEYGNGRTKTQASQLRSLLDTCFNVLDAPEIVDFYGFGTHRDRWTVIDRLHKEPPFESVPNLSALKTVAGKGNKVFQWIANFNEATVSDEEFETVIRSAEAWIIAQGSVPQDAGNQSEHDEGIDDFENDEEFDDFDD